MKETFSISHNKSYPNAILVEETFRDAMRDLIPEAVDEIRGMLISPATPPATKAKLIDLILKYGIDDKGKSPE